MTEHEKHTNASASPLRRLLKAFGIGKEHGRERARSEHLRRPNRRAEAGNVFFALFGAVAVVGVLGAGIMSTMRGPLTTMVEINRIEEAKSVIRLNSRLVLQNATRGMGGDCDDDDFTEAPDPVTATDGIADGGTLPTNVGATRTDPWGTPYGYCSWNHGPDPNTCTNTIDGENSTTEVTIAIVSAGPDREFTTECGDLYNGDALNDDIATRVPYNDAAAMAGGGTSGGLWSDMGTSAEIGKDLTVTSAGTSAFTGGATFGNDLVTSGTLITNNIQSLDPSDTISISATSTNFDSDLVVNGTNTTTLNGATTINDDLTVTGNTGVEALDVGGVITDAADNLVTVDDGLNVTGAGDFDSTLNVDGIANFESTITSDGDGVVNIDDDLGITGDIVTDVVINSTTADGSTNPLTLYQSDGTTEVFAVDSSGNTDIAGNLTVNTDKFTVDASDGDTIVGGDLTITGDNFSLGTTADNGNGKIMIGQGAPDNNFAAKSVTGDVTLDKDGDIQIKAGVVDTNELADGAVTNLKIADGAVDTDELADGAVDENKIKATNTAGSDECLKFDGTDLEWGNCYTSGGGGDGVGAATYLGQLLDNTGSPDGGDGSNQDIFNVSSIAVGSSVFSDGTGTGGQLLEVDITGDLGAINYCDADGLNCFIASDVGKSDRIIDAPDAVQGESNGDTYIDVDTTDNGQTNSIIFVNDGTTNMTILPTGQVNMATHATIGGNLAVDTSVLFVETDTNDNVGIGTATPLASAILDITSTTQGILPPRMTLTQRDAMDDAYGAPETGMVIFATDAGDSGLLQFWDGSAWIDVGGGGADTGGLWAPDDAGGNFIEYDDTALGGMRVGRIDGQAAPAIDWTLDVANSLVYTDHAVGIGVSSISDDSGANTDVMLDLSGDVAAIEYCDTSGANCFSAGDISSLSTSANLWTDNTEYITRENFHILNAGETMTSAGFDNTIGNAFVWHPDKHAFRAGSSGGGPKWNEAEIGTNSFVMGNNSRATNNVSFAFGHYTDVTGEYALGMGNDADALADGATSIGRIVEASGTWSHARGNKATVSGTNSWAFGLADASGPAFPTVSGASSLGIFMGDQSGVDLNAGQTMGLFGGNLLIDPAVPATQLTARGVIDAGAATDAIVLPSGTTGERPVTGVDGMLRFNSDNDAYEVYSSTAGDWVEIVSGGTPGLWTDLGGDRIHYGNDGDNVQVGIGTNNPVTTLDVNGGVRVGSVSAAPPAYLALNSLTDVDTSPSDGECLVYDTGSGNWENGACDDASNALWTDNTTHITRENFHILDTGETIDSAGFSAAGGGSGFAGMIYDTDNNALRGGTLDNGSNAWDDSNIGENSFAWGWRAMASGGDSIALGDSASATASNTVAIGSASSAGGSGSAVAIGFGASSSGGSSIAMGRSSSATGTDSVAVGTSVRASGDYSTAYGREAEASGISSVAIGAGDASGTRPLVSGDNSFGIFMGDQTGVDVTASNVMAIMGGQVGIGTADPQATLDVNGGIRMAGVSGGAPTTPAPPASLWTDDGSGNINNTDGGNVGIGISAPKAPLHVNGEAIVGVSSPELGCDADSEGALRYRTGVGVEYCDGTSWKTLAATGTGIQLQISPQIKNDMDVDGSGGAPATGTTITFTITNAGDQTSDPLTHTLTGDTGNFNILANTCTGATLGQNQTCQIDIQPVTSGNNIFRATLAIPHHNAPSAALEGEGVNFDCSTGMQGFGGVVVQCDYAGAGNHLVAMESGCDGTLSEPTCSGNDSYTTRWSPADNLHGPIIQSANDGAQNTVNALSYGRSAGSLPAIEYCGGLTHNAQTDWFLPSTEQLTAAYTNISAQFVSDIYWSSREDDDDSACSFNMPTGEVRCQYASADKTTPRRSRCMRVEGVALPAAQSDTTPETITFNSDFATSAGVATTSSTETITGITTGTSISISGASAEYSINGGAFTSSAGSVNWGDTVAVRIDSGAAGTSVQADLTIGSSTFPYSVNTLGDCGGAGCTGVDKRVFVTSVSDVRVHVSATFADNKCQTAADNAGLGGTWMAIYSNASSPAIDRIDYNWDRLVTMNGDVIANSPEDLWDGAITNSISYDENGVYKAVAVSTNTDEFGSFSDNVSGRSENSDSNWIDRRDDFTNDYRSAYCLEVAIGDITLESTPSSGASMNATGPGSPATGSEVIFTIENTGTSPSATLGTSLSNSTNFQITTNTCTGNTLAAGATCTMGVTPQASADGDYFGTLTVEDSSNNVSVNIGMSGQSTGFGDTASKWQDGTAGDIYYADGNVGVGTSFPQTDFDVSDLLLNQGTGNCPADYTEGDYDGGDGSADCRMTGLTVNKSNGHVGIGTTPSGSVLNVDGDGNNSNLIRAGNFGTRFTVGSPGGNGRMEIHSGAQVPQVSLGAAGNSYINTNLGLDDDTPDAKLEISANGSTTGNALFISSDDDSDGDIMTVTNGGQVGIGTDTPGTEAMLHIVNTSPASAWNYDTGLVIDTNTGGSSFGTALKVNGDQLVVGNSWGTPEVSIGGAGDDTPLTVAGRTGTGIANILSILPTNSNNTPPVGQGARMLFRASDNSYTRRSYAGIAGIVIDPDNTNLQGALTFYSTNSGTLTEVGRFDSQGDFGIGVTDPQAKLDVDGDIQYTGTLTDVSDRRLKTDITPLGAEDMIARLSAVDTYSFRMKDDEKGRTEFGVMAQELEEIFPELVNTAEDEMGTKSVNYTGLIAPMIEATKALQSENEALKAELNAVKQQQQKVLASLETMQSDLNGMKVHTGYGIEKGSAIAMLLLLLSLGAITATILVQRQKSALAIKQK